MTAEQMATIHALCFKQPRPWSTQEFSELLESDTVFLCTATQGFALGRIAGPEVELLTIAVAPKYRRQGIAQKLMNNFLGQAKVKGASDAFLEVAENNVGAIALYQLFNFSHAGFRKNYYSNPTGTRISALVMNRRI